MLPDGCLQFVLQESLCFLVHVVHNCRLKTSGITLTRLLKYKQEIDTVQHMTEPPADNVGLAIYDLHNQEGIRDSDGDSDEEVISRNINDDYQVFSFQTVNHV